MSSLQGRAHRVSSEPGRAELGWARPGGGADNSLVAEGRLGHHLEGLLRGLALDPVGTVLSLVKIWCEPEATV